MKIVTISGLEFELDEPYKAGHTVNEAEAKTLNQTRAENIRNNMAKKVKEMNEGGESKDAIQAAVTEYASTYVFAMPGPGTGGRVTDPVEREARKMARDYIAAKCAERGTTPKAFYATDTEEGKEAYNVKVLEFANNPKLRAKAEKLVKDQKNALESLGGLDESDEAEAA